MSSTIYDLLVFVNQHQLELICSVTGIIVVFFIFKASSFDANKRANDLKFDQIPGKPLSSLSLPSKKGHIFTPMVAMKLNRHSDPLVPPKLTAIVEDDESKHSKLSFHSNQSNMSHKSINSLNSIQSISSLNSTSSSHPQSDPIVPISLAPTLSKISSDGVRGVSNAFPGRPLRPQPVTIDHASGVFYSNVSVQRKSRNTVNEQSNIPKNVRLKNSKRNQISNPNPSAVVHPKLQSSNAMNVLRPKHCNQQNQAIQSPEHLDRDSLGPLKSLNSLQSLIGPNNGNRKINELSISPISISRHISSDMESPAEHIERMQHELESTNYPEYMDGYSALSRDQKRFVNLIKKGDLNKVMLMSNGSKHIRGDINFGQCHPLRECALSGRLEILKYLKKTFVDTLDLNGESGYLIRWAARKGRYDMVHWLLLEQSFQKIDISFMYFQCMEWAVIYRHKAIAKLIQKYYREQRMHSKWNEVVDDKLEASALGLQFEISNLPNIYQEVIELIIGSPDVDGQDADAVHAMNEETVRVLTRYWNDGLDLKFENCLLWTVAVDCCNVPVLEFLRKTVQIDSMVLNGYLLTTSLSAGSLEMVQYAKTVISWQRWKREVVPRMKELKKMCRGQELLKQELDNYHGNCQSPLRKKPGKFELPQSPIPWQSDNDLLRKKYGILTRSVKKMLVRKSVLQ